MLFNSLHFLFFFPAVVALFFAVPQRMRWGLLLVASYYFYMCWRWEYVFLIAGSTLVDYVAALGIAGTTKRALRRGLLVASLAVNLGVLFLFKYLDFFSEATRAFLERFDVFVGVPEFDLLLPVGISFYTFQSMSYTIDVYRGHTKPERHLGIFALYVSFFPQLVAGPIERSTRLLPQFRRHADFDYARVTDGLKLMAWGFFKKLVVADKLALLVDHVYANPGEHSGAVLLVATYAFAYQIYCDFSGYSDIAIGAAQVMGYELMNNFERPYRARSIADFWRRWHISLSTWFRDYVYLALGGNRVAVGRWCVNIAAVFLLSGLWHGANWTFVAWGALHGGYYLASRATSRLRERGAAATGLARAPRLHAFVQVVVTFHLVVLAWVFFRAGSVSDAWVVLQGIATDFSFADLGEVPLPPFHLAAAVACILVMEVVQSLQAKGSVRARCAALPAPLRWGLYYSLLLAILLLGEFGGGKFIYFQF